jgi:hypothetical protein
MLAVPNGGGRFVSPLSRMITDVPSNPSNVPPISVTPTGFKP